MIRCKPQGTAGDLLTASARGQGWVKKEIVLSRAPRWFSRNRFARALADVFEKNEKKNKTTSVYGLALLRRRY